MDIDQNAAITASGCVESAATPEDVWALLTDLAGWPTWNPDVSEVRLEGPLAPGTTFRWRAVPGTITSVLRSVVPLRERGWTGKTLGIHAVHVWRLEQIGSGTVLTTRESWRGWPARLVRRRAEARLREAVATGLDSLKSAAEARARAARSRQVA